MTGQEFRDYVVNNFKRTDKDTELYEHTTDVVNEMLMRLDGAEDYKEEGYTTGINTLGEYQMELPSDFGHIIGDVRLTNPTTNQEYSSLVKISKSSFDKAFADRDLTNGSNRGVPVCFCIYANRIYLGPVPDSINYEYQINYVTRLTSNVTSATTSVPFTDKYRHIVRNGVLAELHAGMENVAESQFYKLKYEEGLEYLKGKDFHNTASNENIVYHGV